MGPKDEKTRDVHISLKCNTLGGMLKNIHLNVSGNNNTDLNENNLIFSERILLSRWSIEHSLHVIINALKLIIK